jgi:hypothetical protein
VALVAFEGGAVLDQMNRGLADRAGQDLEEFRVYRHGRIIAYRLERRALEPNAEKRFRIHLCVVPPSCAFFC